jgi:hypothetical protein
MATSLLENRAWAAKTLPLRRWQARQWQIETRTGSPLTLAVIWPQLQEAERVIISPPEAHVREAQTYNVQI